MDAIAAIAEVLDAREIRWAVVGAHAANFYRDDIRSTMDVDVLVSLGAAGIRELAEGLVDAGWRIGRLYPEDWLLRVMHPTFGSVDVIATGVEYQEVALLRAQPKVFPNGVTAKVLAVEDVLIHKLIANRAQDEACCRGLGSCDEFHGRRDRYEGVAGKEFEQSCGRNGCRVLIQHAGPVGSDDGEEFACGQDGFIRDGRDSVEEEDGPALPVTVGANRAKASVVLLAMALEEQAEVQERRTQETPMLEQERDQQPADATVSVEIGVDGLELRMGQTGTHERRKFVVRMQVPFEIPKQFGECMGRWRHIDRDAWSASANPVLASPHRAWLLASASYAVHQPAMGLVQKPHAKWQAMRSCKLAASVAQRIKVVADLLDLHVGARTGFGFEPEQIHVPAGEAQWRTWAAQ